MQNTIQLIEEKIKEVVASKSVLMDKYRKCGDSNIEQDIEASILKMRVTYESKILLYLQEILQSIKKENV